jgi:hypothetical protein
VALKSVANGQWVTYGGEAGKERLVANGQVRLKGYGVPIFVNSEIFTFKTIGYSTVSLQVANGKQAANGELAPNGRYVVAEGGGGGGLFANRPALGPWETFTVVDLGDNQVALKTSDGKYVSAQGEKLVADRAGIDGIRPSETFTLVNESKDGKGDFVSLIAPNGRYVTYEGGGEKGRLVANGGPRGKAGIPSPPPARATFALRPIRYSTVALAVNGLYVTDKRGVGLDQGGEGLFASGSGFGSWDTFTVVDLGPTSFTLIDPSFRLPPLPVTAEEVALKAADGKYVTDEGGKSNNLVANQDFIGPQEIFSLINLGNNTVVMRAGNGRFVIPTLGLQPRLAAGGLFYYPGLVFPTRQQFTVIPR